MNEFPINDRYLELWRIGEEALNKEREGKRGDMGRDTGRFVRVVLVCTFQREEEEEEESVGELVLMVRTLEIV